MDYAGGATVHASSGLAAVAYAMVLGKRKDYDEKNNTPHNVSFVYIGLAFLWFGWFAFNAGSALAANARAANSLVATHLAACVAAVVWVLMDYFYSRKWSVVGLCTGVVAGLATVTPGSGYVSPSSALLFGLLGSIACNYAVRYKHKYHFDDALDVFTVHYIGGLVGLVLTGVFAERYIIGLGMPEGTPEDEIQIGGWLDGHWVQVPIQLAMIAAVSGWSFVVTYIMLVIINRIPCMKLRLDDHAEHIGTDWAQMGERAYGYIQWEEEMRRASTVDGQSIQQAAASTKSKKGALRRIKKMFLVGGDRTVVKGVPNLIEEPVLDYSQPKETGNIHLQKIEIRPTKNETAPAPQNVALESEGSVIEILPAECGQSSGKASQSSNVEESSCGSSSSSSSTADSKQKSRA